MSCKNCRNLGEIMDCGGVNKIACEVYSVGYTEEPEKCKGYLSVKCKDQKKIDKNIKIVTNMYLAELESLLE